MGMSMRSLACVVCVASILLTAGVAAAQIEGQLSAYTGDNAEGYLQPLADAIGTDLNGGLFHSAYIPEEDGLHIYLETRVIAVKFSDDDKTFSGVAESGFVPETAGDLPATVPTVVGDGDAVVIDGESGTSFAFPGGFDLGSFTIAVPQLRIGAYKGTEALVRYFAIDTGDVEIGDLRLYGGGLRHNISQYMPAPFPVDLAAGFFWQKFELGDDLISANAFTIGVQASKRFPAGFIYIEPYGGVSYDMFSMDVNYDYESGDDVEEMALEFESTSTARLTMGLNFAAPVLNLNAEYSIASQNSFSFGLGFGF